MNGRDIYLKPSYYIPFQPGYETENTYRNYIVQADDSLYGIVTDFYEFSVGGGVRN